MDVYTHTHRLNAAELTFNKYLQYLLKAKQLCVFWHSEKMEVMSGI